MTALPETFSSSLTMKTTLRRPVPVDGAAGVSAPAEAAQRSEIAATASAPSQLGHLTMSDLHGVIRGECARSPDVPRARVMAWLSEY
jgi:hypothetical protein